MELNEAALELKRIEIIEKQIKHLQDEAKESYKEGGIKGAIKYGYGKAKEKIPSIFSNLSLIARAASHCFWKLFPMRLTTIGLALPVKSPRRSGSIW